MDNIIEPNDNFDFSSITLAHPVSIQGGAYFTKIENNKKNLYIQTDKSLTRQGFVKSGKKYYCDLMFDKNSEKLINWFENLEIKCRKLILEKSDAWFQGSLEENDIETAFNSIIRIYKSGKYYLVRANVKNNNLNVPSIKIYDENEMPLNLEDIKQETEIISILEIQGIKFTSRNFQIEIEIKQVMVINEQPVFNSCLIKKEKNSVININSQNTTANLDNTEDINKIAESVINNLEEITEVKPNFEIANTNVTMDITNLNKNKTNENLEKITKINTENNTKLANENDNNFIKNSLVGDENISLDLEIVNLDEKFEENNDELREIDTSKLNLDNSESLQLKKPNEVYFELYKAAKEKAKIAKKNAILAYLEAKNIKKLYMIESIDDGDSDFEAEIDDVSESELENF